MSDIKTLLKQYETVNAELNKQIRKNGDKFIQELFQDIFDKHEGLNVIGIIGWTMGFNDGEACYHQQYTYTGDMQHSSWDNRFYPDFQDEAGNFEEEFEYDEEENTHLNSQCQTLDQAKYQVEKYDEIIERIYNTNFRIVITKGEDGKVIVDHDYYDCGY